MKTAMHLCFILASLSVIASMSVGIGQKQQHSREKRRIELSRREGLDVTFLIDTSGSIQLREFRSAIMFVKLFAKKIGLSRRMNGARIAVLTTEARPWDDFRESMGFETPIGTSLETVLLLLDDVQHNGGDTNLTASLSVYKRNMIPINLSRSFYRESPVPKQYLFILSDGQYTRGGNPVNIAKELKEEIGVEIFSIKIGDGVSSYSQRRATNVLIGMSSEAEMNRDGMDPHYFDLRHYPTAEYLVQQLINGSIDYSECGIAGKTDITLGNIINGRVAQPGAWPWMVAIFRSRAAYAPPSAFSYLCGGTLLDREWVLTSAHCFMEQGTKTNPARFRVMLGGTNNRHIELNDFLSTTFRMVRSIHFHPGWGSGPFRIPNHDGSWADDIALLHLDISVPYSSTTRRVCLPSLNQDVTDEIGVITGWGVAANLSLSTSDVRSSYDQSDELRQAQIPIVTHDENPFRCPRRSAEKIICAGSVTELVDSCRGDDGGPLMIKVENGTDAPRWYQIGITSFGEGCADPNYPFGRYTDVRQYVDWIETTMLNAGP